MPQLAPYIPTKDVLLDTWSANFSTLITANPATYGLTAADATAIAAVVASWHAAYLLVTSSSTKTAATVSAKDTQKQLLLATCRPYAIIISLNAGVSSANKIAVGVNPRTSVPVPIAQPVTMPVLSINPLGPLTHAVRYRDSLASPSVKSKPYGAIGMQLFGLASATPITNPNLLLYMLDSGKSPFSVTLASGDVGKQQYYAGRWITRRGLVGPWSSIVNATVNG